MHRISDAHANADFTLDLRFEDGRMAHIDIADIVKSAEIAAAFRKAERFISALTLAENGEILRWSDQFELHADSLRYRAFPDELTRDYGPKPHGRSRPAA
jgi:Protein of unknown function (DUF2442)